MSMDARMECKERHADSRCVSKHRDALCSLPQLSLGLMVMFEHSTLVNVDPSVSSDPDQFELCNAGVGFVLPCFILHGHARRAGTNSACI